MLDSLETLQLRTVQLVASEVAGGPWRWHGCVPAPFGTLVVTVSDLVSEVLCHRRTLYARMARTVRTSSALPSRWTLSGACTMHGASANVGTAGPWFEERGPHDKSLLPQLRRS